MRRFNNFTYIIFDRALITVRALINWYYMSYRFSFCRFLSHSADWRSFTTHVRKALTKCQPISLVAGLADKKKVSFISNGPLVCACIRTDLINCKIIAFLSATTISWAYFIKWNYFINALALALPLLFYLPCLFAIQFMINNFKSTW